MAATSKNSMVKVLPLGGGGRRGATAAAVTEPTAKDEEMKSFRTTLSPNPERFYRYCSGAKTRRNISLSVLFKCFQVPVPVVWYLFKKTNAEILRRPPKGGDPKRGARKKGLLSSDSQVSFE